MGDEKAVGGVELTCVDQHQHLWTYVLRFQVSYLWPSSAIYVDVDGETTGVVSVTLRHLQDWGMDSLRMLQDLYQGIEPVVGLQKNWSCVL